MEGITEAFLQQIEAVFLAFKSQDNAKNFQLYLIKLASPLWQGPTDVKKNDCCLSPPDCARIQYHNRPSEPRLDKTEKLQEIGFHSLELHVWWKHTCDCLYLLGSHWHGPSLFTSCSGNRVQHKLFWPQQVRHFKISGTKGVSGEVYQLLKELRYYWVGSRSERLYSIVLTSLDSLFRLISSNCASVTYLYVISGNSFNLPVSQYSYL